MKNAILFSVACMCILLGSVSAQAYEAEVWQCRAQCVIADSRGDEFTDRFSSTGSFESQKATPLEALKDIQMQCTKRLNASNSSYYVFSVVISMVKKFRPAPQSWQYDLVTILATPGNACAKL